MQDAVAGAFLVGEIYFRGRPVDKHGRGTTFATLLRRVAEDHLGTLYGQFVAVAVSPKELEQLLEPELTGPSPKFMPEQLGILAEDVGRLTATCTGEVPRRLRRFIEEQDGASGIALLAHFGQSFSSLDEDQSFQALRPIEDALIETTADAVEPSLVELRDRVDLRLARADEEAEERIDAELATVTGTEVKRLRLGLAGREVASEEDVDDLLDELRERLLRELRAGEKVRIRLV